MAIRTYQRVVNLLNIPFIIHFISRTINRLDKLIIQLAGASISLLPFYSPSLVSFFLFIYSYSCSSALFCSSYFSIWASIYFLLSYFSIFYSIFYCTYFLAVILYLLFNISIGGPKSLSLDFSIYATLSVFIIVSLFWVMKILVL